MFTRPSTFVGKAAGIVIVFTAIPLRYTITFPGYVKEYAT